MHEVDEARLTLVGDERPGVEGEAAHQPASRSISSPLLVGHRSARASKGLGDVVRQGPGLLHPRHGLVDVGGHTGERAGRDRELRGLDPLGVERHRDLRLDRHTKDHTVVLPSSDRDSTRLGALTAVALHRRNRFARCRWSDVRWLTMSSTAEIGRERILRPACTRSGGCAATCARTLRRSASWPLAAIGAVGLTITIPLVTKALIDGPITERDLSGVLPLGLLALALGVLEAVLIWVRRWFQSDAVLPLETEIRHDLYERLQLLPMSFHTQWQSGPAAVAGHHRPVRDPPVRRLRPAVPGAQRPPAVGDDRGAAAHVLAAGAGRGRHRRADHLAVHAVREVVRRGVPPRAGRAGRPGHPRRGGRGRDPGHQVLRPGRARLGAVRRGRARSCTRRAWTRSGCRRGSGPSSR